MQGRVRDIGGAESSTVERTLRVPEAGPATSARVQYRSLYRRIALTDVLAIAAGLIVAHWLRYDLGLPRGDFLLLLVGTPPAILVVYSAFGLYHAHRFTPAEEFRRIILAVTVGLIGLVTLSFWSMASLSRSRPRRRGTLGVLFALASRRVWHWVGVPLADRGPVPVPDPDRSGSSPAIVPKAMFSASAWGPGRRWMPSTRGAHSWCRPANASSISDSMPALRATRQADACCSTCSRSAVLPTPGSPRRTSTLLCPARTAASTASSSLHSSCRPRRPVTAGDASAAAVGAGHAAARPAAPYVSMSRWR